MENLCPLIGQQSEYLSAQFEGLRGRCRCSSCGVVTMDIHFRNVVFSQRRHHTFTEEQMSTRTRGHITSAVQSVITCDV